MWRQILKIEYMFNWGGFVWPVRVDTAVAIQRRALISVFRFQFFGLKRLILIKQRARL
jgi:hypothetical protein